LEALGELFPDNYYPDPVPLQLPQQMAYQLSNRATVMQLSKWYRVETLYRLLESFRSRNPAVVAVRGQMLQELNSSTTACPYAANARFGNASYVCELDGAWLGLFQQLRTALTYKPAANVGRRRIEGGTSSNELENQANDDVIVAFWNCTATMIEKIANGDGVLNRVSFEISHAEWH
jgi:hypothetical protein